MIRSRATAAPFFRFAAAAVLSLLGIAAAASPLASNAGPLAGYSGLVIGLGCLAGFLLYLHLAGERRWRWAVLVQGIIAAVVLPGGFFLMPLFMCVFITHGTCS